MGLDSQPLISEPGFWFELYPGPLTEFQKYCLFLVKNPVLGVCGKPILEKLEILENCKNMKKVTISLYFSNSYH